MFESMFSTLSAGIGEAMDGFIVNFLQLLTSVGGEWERSFPGLAVGYSIFQYIAIGMCILIAGLSLLAFSFGAVETKQMTDSVIGIAFKTFFAVILIFQGRAVINAVISMCSDMYSVFFDLLATDTMNTLTKDAGLVNLVSGLHEKLISGTYMSGMGTLSTALVALVIVIAISWNLLKVVLELCQRLLMVGLLSYTSPLFYPCMISNSTSSVFRKWVSMVIGSNLLMVVTAFMLFVTMTGFEDLDTLKTNEAFCMRLILILAMCKITQKIDNIMNTLGIGITPMSSGLLEDFFIVGKSLSSLGKAVSSGITNRINAANSGARSRFTGVGGGIYNGINAGAQAYNKGATMRDSFEAARQEYRRTRTDDPFKDVSAAGKASRERTQGQPFFSRAADWAKSTGPTAAAAAGTAAYRFVNPEGAAMRDNAPQATAAERAAAAARSRDAAKSYANMFTEHSSSASPSPNVSNRPKTGEGTVIPMGGKGIFGGPSVSKFEDLDARHKDYPKNLTDQFFAANGVGSMPVTADLDGSLKVTTQAKYAGLNYEEAVVNAGTGTIHEPWGVFRSSNEQVTAEAMATMYNDGAKYAVQLTGNTLTQDERDYAESLTKTMEATVDLSSAAMAESMLMDKRFDLSGYEKLGTATVTKALDIDIPEGAVVSNFRAQTNQPHAFADGETGGYSRTVSYNYDVDNGASTIRHDVRILDASAYESLLYENPAGFNREDFKEIHSTTDHVYYVYDKSHERKKPQSARPSNAGQRVDNTFKG